MSIKVSVISTPKNRISIKGSEQKVVRVSTGGISTQGGPIEEPFPTGDYGLLSLIDRDEFGVYIGRIYDCNDPSVLRTVDFGVL